MVHKRGIVAFELNGILYGNLVSTPFWEDIFYDC